MTNSTDDLMGLYSRGYVVLERVVRPETVERLRTIIEAIVAQPTNDAGVDVRAGTTWIRNLRGIAPELDTLPDELRVQAAVRTLLGDQTRLEGISMRNPIGPTAHQSLHVDWAGPIPPGLDQKVQVLVLVDDMHDNNGPTRVVPGTHRSGAIPPRQLADASAAHPDEVRVHGNAGDVVVFSSHLWHSGTGNRSGQPRRAITLSFLRE